MKKLLSRDRTDTNFFSNFGKEGYCDFYNAPIFFPKENNELLPGVKWGNCFQLYTPAFWKLVYHFYQFDERQDSHKLGATVVEEIVACLLGGYGMPSELGILAFESLKRKSLIHHRVQLHEIKNELSQSFIINGKPRKYRFHQQKSKYVHKFLNREDLCEIPLHNDLLFRDWLLTIDGVGPKTASWITRNWLQSENVAILDIHILRAGMIAGIFKNTQNLSTEYFHLENSYIAFCKAIDVLPSNMDAVMWGYMKKTNRFALKVLSSL